ncbi:MAG: DUF21 domain-containing protein [Candidatus Omnitrophica bacterium]|nr:DUF21 domain-containing protein [Candidatus Omnitrophota bacterium]MBD3269032.1 DUF21 domain-containing protein [Candidatus Omnitrophota bacterium]
MFNFFVFACFIVISAFFSASETAIFSLSNFRLRRIQERYRQAKTVKNLLKNPTHLLSAIVFGNLLVNIGISSLATTIFVKRWGENGLIMAIVFSTGFIIFFGEILPKTFAIYKAERISLLTAPLINVFSRLFSPIILAIEKVVRYFSFFLLPRGTKTVLSDEEFKTLLYLGKQDGQISEQEENMISNVLEFKETQASEIMTARIDTHGIDINTSQDEVLEILKKTKHSKIPVYENSLDNITGILYTKDVFLNPQRPYHDFLHEPVFVPESMKIDDILKLFLVKKERIAIVLDEYGGTEGIITLEDIVEEIFGEIYDEFETIEEPLKETAKNQWKVFGKAPIKSVNMELNIQLPEEEDTLAGFLLSKMERIPATGDEFDYNGLKFIIDRATKRKIVSVTIRKNKGL